MTFESDALNFWLDFKNIEFFYTIVKYYPHFKSTFLYDWLGDKEDMSLQRMFFHCQLTPSYSNNTGYYEVVKRGRRGRKHITFLFASFSVFSFFFLSTYILEHAFFLFQFFFSTLLAIVCSNFQFANNCRTSLVGGPEMTASASWSLPSWGSSLGPRGPFSNLYATEILTLLFGHCFHFFLCVWYFCVSFLPLIIHI